jgi:hypothetical protein
MPIALQCSMRGRPKDFAMKYWLVCITAALSLMALVPFHAQGAVTPPARTAAP